MRKKWSIGLVWCMAPLIAVPVTPAFAQQLEFKLRQGYNTNVYEVGATSLSGRVDAYYSRFGIAYKSPSSPRGTSLIVGTRGHVTWYPQTSSGNALGGSLLLRLRNVWSDRKPGGGKKIRLDVDVSGEYERALFLKRSVREELRIGSVDAALPLRELPTRAEGKAQATVRARVSNTLTLKTAAFGQLRKYVDSENPSVPGYEKLDARELGGLLEVSVDVARAWELSGSARWRSRVYPKRSARTSQGEEVLGEERQFWYWDLGARVGFRSGAVRNRAHVAVVRRDDRYAGYYSYDEWEVGDRLKFELTSMLDLWIRYSYGQLQYDLFGPSGSPRSNKYHDARAEVEIRLAPSWRLVIGPHYERTLSNDPIFEYEQVDVFGEIRIAP